MNAKELMSHSQARAMLESLVMMLDFMDSVDRGLSEPHGAAAIEAVNSIQPEMQGFVSELKRFVETLICPAWGLIPEAIRDKCREAGFRNQNCHESHR